MFKASLIFAAAMLLGSCTSRHLALTSPTAPHPDDDDDDEGQGTPAAEWNLSRRVAPGATDIATDRYRAATDLIARMPRYSTALGARGTARIPAGPEGWTFVGPGNVGGRTRSLVINPKDPNILYSGAVSGGVWKSTDAGKNWSAITDGLPNINIGALAMDPANPNIIYAGGGEQYDSKPGVGIYKTADGGATWNLMPGTTAANFTNFQYVNRIVVSPNNSLQIYAATRTGIMTTRDGGATWAKASINAPYYGCQDLVIRTDVPTDYLFAACSGLNATETFSIYRNVDAAGAGTWVPVHTAKNMSRSVIGIAPSKQSTIYVAASGNPASPRDGVGLAGVFRSTSSGDPGSWATQVSGDDSNPFNFLLFSTAGSSTGAFCANGTAVKNEGGTWGKLLAVDPLDPDKVWVGGVDLFRSDDGGLTWGVASEWTPSSAPAYSHADRHLLVFAPNYDGAANQTAYQLTDGGVFRTDNARAAVSTGVRAGCIADYQRNSAVTWTALNHFYSTTQFYKGAVYPGGSIYLGGSQDTGTNRGRDGDVNAWTALGGGDGGSVALDPLDNNRLMVTAQTLSLQRTVNGGALSSAIRGITEDPTKFPFEAYLAVDPREPNNVYLGGATNLWQSTDWAANWTASAATGANGAVSAIAVSPSDSNTVFFGTSTGFIYRSSNALDAGGGSWTSVRPRTGNVAGIAIDASSTPTTIYATYSSLKSNTTQAHVYRSTDGGQTWTPSDGAGSTSVPDIPVWRILVDPRNPRILYLGTDLGLMISQDGGATWGHDDGIPNVIIEDLAFDAVSAGPPNYLFAFTFGRGAWRTPLPGAITACTSSVTPQTITAGPEGGVFAVTVSTPTGCGWSALPGTSAARFAVQSPAQGIGNGTAYIAVPPNLAGTAGSDTITVAGQAVAVSQPATTFLNLGDDQQASAPSLAIPSVVRRTVRTFSALAGDPVHSCTGSADFATAWWKVTPSSEGTLSVQARGDRLDVFGNSGIVVTAYAQSAPATELGCATIPRDTVANTVIGIRFPVTAGETYLIEIAATSPDGANANYNLIVAPGTLETAVSLTPPNLTVSAGSGPQQLTAVVTGPANQGVRWSIAPPLGTISQTGAYTPPASIASSTDVIVTATSFADSTRKAVAKLTVVPVTISSSITISAAGIVNGATFQGGGVAPGEIVTVFGAGFGPSSLTGLSLGPDGKVSTTSGGTSLLFDGVASPMIYAVSGQLSAIVPYSVAGKGTAQVQVAYNGQRSAAVSIPVAAASPGLFTANSSGKGQLAMFNQDNSLNSPSAPADRGSTVILYGTGEGQTLPAGVDGQVNASIFPAPTLSVKVTIGGVEAKVPYFGAAPSFVSGVFQANVIVPANVTPGSAVPVVVTVGGISNPSGVTMAVK